MKPNFSYSECYDIVDQEKAAVIESVDVDVETTDATGDVFWGIVKLQIEGKKYPRSIQGEHHINDWKDEFGIVINFDK
jgi:hypothetical protein